MASYTVLVMCLALSKMQVPCDIVVQALVAKARFVCRLAGT